MCTKICSLCSGDRVSCSGHWRRFSPRVILAAGIVALSACGSKTDLIIGSDGHASDAAGQAGVSAGGAASAGFGGIAGGGGVSCTPVGDPALGLAHRYSFDGLGGSVPDSVGGEPGMLVPPTGGTFDGQGTLSLDGSTGYVDLPNHLLQGLGDATFMVWTSWPKGGSGFERIFDFGTGNLGENPPGNSAAGTNYLMATPFTDRAASKYLGTEFRTPSTGIIQLSTPISIKDPMVHQVCVVFHSELEIDLYLDAKRVGSVPIVGGKLADIDDVNDWLGRSQTGLDNRYTGTYSEFRIYKRALDDCTIATARALGPDAL